MELSPVIYHCVSRSVGGQSIFGDAERSHLRMFMRSQEQFSGCRVLAYCMMPDHFHILVEVPPLREGGMPDDELIRRLGEVREESFVETVAKDLAEARAAGDGKLAEQIHARYSYRMNDLGEFMKTFVQRFTCWFNSTHKRKGTLWEGRYKSVIVEAGLAARSLAGYIDLNPVRAGLVDDPAKYRWSSYGEAVSGKVRKGKETARQGLVGAWSGHPFGSYDAAQWKETIRGYREFLGLSTRRKTPAGTERNTPEGRDFAAMLRKRIRHFSDGAAIGSKLFVEAVFEAQRDQFPADRKDGARLLAGNARTAAGILWSLRALRTDISG